MHFRKSAISCAVLAMAIAAGAGTAPRTESVPGARSEGLEAADQRLAATIVVDTVPRTSQRDTLIALPPPAPPQKDTVIAVPPPAPPAPPPAPPRDTVVAPLPPGSGGGPEEDTTVGNVPPEAQNKLLHRRKAMYFSHASFGPGVLTNLGAEGVGYTLNVAGVWEVNPHADVRVLGTSFFDPGDNAYIFAPALGMIALLSNTDFSPFIGGDFGYGIVDGGQDDAGMESGFGLGLSLGVQFFRTSSTQMTLEGRYYTVFTDYNDEGNPMAYGLALGILF